MATPGALATSSQLVCFMDRPWALTWASGPISHMWKDGCLSKRCTGFSRTSQIASCRCTILSWMMMKWCGRHTLELEKRGGNLCAPIPKPLGFSGYLNDMTKELLAQRMHEYKELVSKYPRGGRGVEELC